MRHPLGLVGLVAALLALSPVCTGQAQTVGVVQSEVLVLDTERLMAETLLGKRITAELQAQREKLIARNRKIEAELEAEEQALTDMRAQKTPQEFRVLADAFDQKVQEIRRDSERAVRDLERNLELAPGRFMRAVQPALVALLRESKGAVIMDQRSVLLRADVVDITDVAISRIDDQLGDGQPDEGNSATGAE